MDEQLLAIFYIFSTAPPSCRGGSGFFPDCNRRCWRLRRHSAVTREVQLLLPSSFICTTAACFISQCFAAAIHMYSPTTTLFCGGMRFSLHYRSHSRTQKNSLFLYMTYCVFRETSSSRGQIECVLLALSHFEHHREGEKQKFSFKL